jgi:hypothetical protein
MYFSQIVGCSGRSLVADCFGHSLAPRMSMASVVNFDPLFNALNALNLSRTLTLDQRLDASLLSVPLNRLCCLPVKACLLLLPNHKLQQVWRRMLLKL